MYPVECPVCKACWEFLTNSAGIVLPAERYSDAAVLILLGKD